MIRLLWKSENVLPRHFKGKQSSFSYPAKYGSKSSKYGYETNTIANASS